MRKYDMSNEITIKIHLEHNSPISSVRRPLTAPGLTGGNPPGLIETNIRPIPNGGFKVHLHCIGREPFLGHAKTLGSKKIPCFHGYFFMT